MRILLITDAWPPQVNGVVRTWQNVVGKLKELGHVVEVIEPGMFRTVPMPTYPDIRLALATAGMVRKRIKAFGPDRVHIATEGPLGFAGHKACRKLGLCFTTSYHTRFPEYVAARLPVPLSWSYAMLRRFHNSGEGCLVATKSIGDLLKERGFENVITWTRGVDRHLFKPQPRIDLGLKGPVFMNVGRIAVEKNLEAFLDLDLPGTKVMVGDGPDRKMLEKKFPDVVFLGEKHGVDLAQSYAMADVFVFPSLTDTFGNVMLEALSCGVPVAAFPVPGPADVIGNSRAGVLDNDLRKACLAALELDRNDAIAHSARFSWDECTRIFLEAGAGVPGTDEAASQALSQRTNA